MLITDAIKLGLELGLSITDKDIVLVPTNKKKTIYGYKYREGKIGEILFYMGFFDGMTDCRNAEWEIMEQEVWMR